MFILLINSTFAFLDIIFFLYDQKDSSLTYEFCRVNARFGMGEDGNLSGQPNLAQGCGVFNQYNNMSVEEANAIRCELQSIQQSLAVGEQEKTELMKNLACLKDDLTRLQHSDSSLDVSSASAAAYAAGNNGDGQGENSSVPIDRFSTASQTDLSGEVRYVSCSQILLYHFHSFETLFSE